MRVRQPVPYEVLLGVKLAIILDGLDLELLSIRLVPHQLSLLIRRAEKFLGVNARSC